MSRFSKWEAQVAKHNHVISPVVLSFVFILVLDLITPTLLLAAEVSQPYGLNNDQKSERAQLEMQKLELLKQTKQNASTTAAEISKIKEQYTLLRKKGVNIPESAMIKVEKAEMAAKNLKKASLSTEDLVRKQEEMKKLYTQVKSDQQNLNNLQDSFKKAENLLKEANKTIVEMRISLSKARAQFENNPEKARLEMQNFQEGVKKLKSIGMEIKEVKIDVNTEIKKVSEEVQKPVVQKNTSSTESQIAGGICLVRDAYAKVPATNDPAVGVGYAYLVKKNDSVSSLRWGCSQDDYTKLLKAYCEKNANPVQLQIAVVNKTGAVETSLCSGFGCGLVSCPQSEVVSPNSSTVVNSVNQ